MFHNRNITKPDSNSFVPLNTTVPKILPDDDIADATDDHEPKMSNQHAFYLLIFVFKMLFCMTIYIVSIYFAKARLRQLYDKKNVSVNILNVYLFKMMIASLFFQMSMCLVTNAY